MAEFSEVMRQFDRMCNAHAGCIDCPLAVAGDIACSIHDFIDNPGRIESNVMKWAAEHPEPVYPTWVDWFREMGVVAHTQEYFHDWLLEPIPADIAKKLGIEPKGET